MLITLKNDKMTKIINIKEVTSIAPIDDNKACRIHFINQKYVDFPDTVDNVSKLISNNDTPKPLIPNRA